MEKAAVTHNDVMIMRQVYVFHNVRGHYDNSSDVEKLEKSGLIYWQDGSYHLSDKGLILLKKNCETVTGIYQE